MKNSYTLLLSVLPLLSYVVPALAQGATCNFTSTCPGRAPCCSEFGFCGTDTFCLGGCNPLWSNKPSSCMPAPICKSGTYNLADTTRILSNATLFDGNSTKYDWVVDKGTIQSSNGELAVTLTEKAGGTRLSSTHYVHYGRITAKVKAGKWKGVVTAFITMANNKDEIDWEWPGTSVTEAQTNLYWQGVPDYSNGQTIKSLQDTSSTYHDYTIDWKPDALTWEIDGKPVRTIKKADLKGAYPSSPSRIQISIWPAGIEGSPQGTIDWAGGMIDWNDPDYVAAGGQYFARFQTLTVECADPAGSVPAGGVSYVYGANVTTAEGLAMPAVSVTNQSTILNGAMGNKMAGVTMWGFWSAVLVGAVGLLY